MRLQRNLLGLTGLYLLMLGASLSLGYALNHVGWLIAADTWLYHLIFEARHYLAIDLLSKPFNYNLLFHVPHLPEDLPTFFYFLITGITVYL
jgi:hypothetical protein